MKRTKTNPFSKLKHTCTKFGTFYFEKKMKRWILICVYICIYFLCLGNCTSSKTSRADSGNKKELYKKAVAYLKQLEPQYSAKFHEMQLILYKSYVDATPDNEEAGEIAETNFNAYAATIQKEISTNYPWWKNLTCKKLKREFWALSLEGFGDMPIDQVQRMNSLRGEMAGGYSRVKVCRYMEPNDCEVRYGEIDGILRKSRDFNETAYYVTAFHNAVNKAISPSTYKEYTDLTNIGSKAKGFPDTGQLRMAQYNDGTEGWKPLQFKSEVEELWKGLKPYYMKMHAYVRMKLGKVYGALAKDENGHMPINILSDMWAQDWLGIDSYTKPFPNAPSLDATEAMKKAGYTVKKMFELAEEYYVGLGLYPMNENFWENSLMVQPEGRDVACHPAAHDLGIKNLKGKTGDYRITMCAAVNHDFLDVIHHEMGHTEYQMHYSHHNFAFRTGANPGFHEAIGDSLALSVATPKHLQCYLKLDMGFDIDCEGNGKTQDYSKPTETDLNLLYLKTLTKLTLLPFAYSLESWRWEVFAGKITPEEYNDRWWQIRKENQGIVPPEKRPSDVFDAGVKFHIDADVGYVRYFISYILQFQFYEELCKIAGEFHPNDPNTKPLYQCDITGSKEAGKKLGDMLKLGYSKPWPDALEVLTGQRALSVTSLLNYFKPIFDLFDKELKEGGEPACFGKNCKA